MYGHEYSHRDPPGDARIGRAEFPRARREPDAIVRVVAKPPHSRHVPGRDDRRRARELPRHPGHGQHEQGRTVAAHAVTGKLAYADALPDLDAAESMGHLFFRPGGTRASTTQTGKDPFSMAASLADMPVGTWGSLTMRVPQRGMLRNEDQVWDWWITCQDDGGCYY